MKTVENLVVGPLSKLINMCFEIMCFLSFFRQATVVPIFKKGDDMDSSNYRPISLLPVFSKIIDNCMASRISAFFECRELFNNSLFGFRNDVGISFSIVDFVADAFQNSAYTLATFRDLSKAFDYVSHEIPLVNLHW